jgi:hypothetical protein
MARRRARPARQEPVVWWKRFTVAQRRLAGSGAALVVAIVLTVVFWPSPTPAPPREREYLEFTACLLTPERGVTDPAAAPVWAAMQDASLKTRAKVQYLQITGAQTPENAVTFLNSLAQGGCNLIFAAGELPVQALGAGAKTFPAKRFVAVGGPGGSSGSANVSSVDAAAPHDEIVRIITDAVSATSK